MRSVFSLLLLLALSRYFGGVAGLATTKWRWHALRTVFAAGAMFGFFYALSIIPLVNALTLAFTAPLIVTALSVPVLGEHVGWRRWLAVSVGFVGVLVMLRPGIEVISVASLAVIAASFCYAFLAVTARMLSTTESTYSLSVYVIAGPLLISSLLLRGNWSSPSLSAWALFALAGLFSAIAWIGIVSAYRRARPAILAPFEYTAIIGGALAGFLIWDEVPDRWVVIGGLIIISSGLFVVYREVGAALSTRYLRGFTAGVAAALAKRNPGPRER